MADKNVQKPAEQSPAPESSTKKALGVLGDKAREDISGRYAVQSNSPTFVANQLTGNADKFVKRMEEVGKQLSEGLRAENIPGKGTWYGRKSEAFSTMRTTSKRLQSIADNLGKKVPNVAKGGTPRHPYLAATHGEYVWGPKARTIPVYHITPEIYDDIEFLQSALRMKGLTSAQKDVIAELLGALNTYASNDWGRATKEKLDKSAKGHFTTKAINKMGQITIVLGAAAAALVMGTVGMAQGKFPTGGMIFAGIAAFTASPSLRAAILGGQNEAALEEINKYVNNKVFQRINKDYKVKGVGWAHFMECMISPDAETQIFIDKMKNTVKGPTPEEKNIFAERMIPLSQDKTGHANLRKMLDDPKAFSEFAKFQFMKNKEAKHTARDYVYMGAGEFLEEVRKVETQYGIHEREQVMLS